MKTVVIIIFSLSLLAALLIAAKVDPIKSVFRSRDGVRVGANLLVASLVSIVHLGTGNYGRFILTLAILVILIWIPILKINESPIVARQDQGARWKWTTMVEWSAIAVLGYFLYELRGLR